MRDISIGELSRRTGVRPSAIRYYEQSGLLLKPPRRSGQRCYDVRFERRLRLIVAGRNAGLGVSQIRALLHAWSPEEYDAGENFRDVIGRELANIDERLQGLQILRRQLQLAIDCNCSSLTNCRLL